MTDRADTIITASQVITMTDAAATDPAPQAFACHGERIVATGELAALRDRFPGAQVHDFGTATVAPGFNDAHQHPTICAEQLLGVDLSPARVRNTDDLVAALAQRAAATPAGEWIVGSGYDHARSNNGAELTSADLDRATAGHPVLVVNVTLHAGVLNSRGIALSGYRTPDDAPSGGELGHDAAGNLNGVLHDQALYDLAFPAFTSGATLVPGPSAADAERAFVAFTARLHAAGITSVTDAVIGPDSWAMLRSLRDQSRLGLRVNALVAYEHFDHFRPLRDQVPAAEDRLRLGGVKAFADGAVNGGACWVEQPVIGATGHGMPRMPADQLHKVIADVHESGWRIAVHANGDRAIRVTLEGIEAAQRGTPRPDPRHRIEHVSLVDDGIVAAFRDLGVVAVPFGEYATAHGDKLRAFYQPERIERMFAHRSLLDGGVAVAGSSDYPCGPYEPLLAMYSCVTRKDRRGDVFGPSQRITPEQALGLYTTGAAYSSGEEHTKGRLDTGYLADFVVLDRDPRAVPGDELVDIAVLQTWVGGERVYQSSNAE